MAVRFTVQGRLHEDGLGSWNMRRMWDFSDGARDERADTADFEKDPITSMSKTVADLEVHRRTTEQSLHYHLNP